MIKTIGKILLWAFLSSLLYVLVCKWVMPPITLTQLANWPSHGLSRDYVGGASLSSHLKLAAIASEDQTFTDHSGFDWDALEKSLRPKKKGQEIQDTTRRWRQHHYPANRQKCLFVAGWAIRQILAQGLGILFHFFDRTGLGQGTHFNGLPQRH